MLAGKCRPSGLYSLPKKRTLSSWSCQSYPRLDWQFSSLAKLITARSHPEETTRATKLKLSSNILEPCS